MHKVGKAGVLSVSAIAMIGLSVSAGRLNAQGGGDDTPVWSVPASPNAAADDASAPVEIDAIDVIGVTPTHGTGLPRSQIPANVQTVTSEELDASQAADITEFMNNRLGSVHVSDGQNNPLQRDVSYRGFTASPLLGLPQGLSMYQDGVRINEPFGDTLNWALIPESSIGSINVVPGSNPLFGRNTLGGALSLQTKTGFTHPGTRAEVYTGSWERYSAQLEHGGSRGDWGWFLTGEYFDEQGWRDFSPSDATKLFGNLSWNQSAATTFDLSLNLADTDLIGNGTVPAGLLALDREAVFTVPDQTLNDLVMFNLRGTHQASSSVLLTGNVYYRMSDIETFNGDDSDFETCEDPANAGFVCSADVDAVTGEETEAVVVDSRLGPVPTVASVGDEDAGIPAGTLNRSETDQDGFGGGLQAAYLEDLFARQNQFILGAEVDRGEMDFNSSTELGALNADRRAIGSGFFDSEAFVDVQSDVNNYSVYFTDTLSVTDALAVTASGRYNYTEVKIDDQLGTALNGDHNYSRFNPALGATYQPIPAIGVYGGYSESSRVPTPVELTCADPNDPCRLPNAFLADPPLDDVVARTLEAGVRGQVAGVNYNLGAFSTTNEDDILFISAGTIVSEGFFDNVGDTRRQGIEFNLDGCLFEDRFNWFVNYTYLDAEFRDSFSVASANHPNPDRVDPNEIDVEPGDQIPLTPDNIVKAGFDVEVIPRLSVGLDVLYNGEQFFRGDESNKEEPVDGFFVMNAGAEYGITERIAVFGRVINVLDEDYETFGLFGEGDELDEKGLAGIPAERNRFLSASAPRAGWIGLRASF